jgi:hypothetical protein
MAAGLNALAGTLARRPWSRRERRVVWQGFLGRLLIAIEPLACAAVFGALVFGLVRLNRPDAPAIVLAPIFGFAALAFIVYAVVLMIGPSQALLETFSPIYIVDGYVRYRRPDLRSSPRANGYVAVLNEDRQLLLEWETTGRREATDRTLPAMVQFARHGGILKIDGHRTGALPEDFPLLGIGAAVPRLPG